MNANTEPLPGLSPADMLLLDRTAMKMAADPALTIGQAMRLVLDDDARIFSAMLKRDAIRDEIVSNLCAKTYERLTRPG